jgi:1,4-alpha-glucan branching enzyme
MANSIGSQKAVRKAGKKVPFVVKGIEAKSISVTGDFSGWSEDGICLTQGLDGEWQTSIKLEPGEYQYRLRVDGEWRSDPSAHKFVPNPFGSDNCVLEVRQGI